VLEEVAAEEGNRSPLKESPESSKDDVRGGKM
jgi:hypothetical protein